MKLQEISFPVYKLSDIKPVVEDGITFYVFEYNSKDGEVIKIIDDTNIPAKSLALRRLRMAVDGVDLFKLSKAIFLLADLIKLSKNNTWFIDSLGHIFQYTKTKLVPLEFKRITKILQIATGGSIIIVEGLTTRFKTLFKVSDEYRYAGVLKLDSKSYILYGVYKEKYKDTRRKI